MAEHYANKVADYQIDRAVSLVTVKLVGYTEVAHTLQSRISPDGHASSATPGQSTGSR